MLVDMINIAVLLFLFRDKHGHICRDIIQVTTWHEKITDANANANTKSQINPQYARPKAQLTLDAVEARQSHTLVEVPV